MVCAGSGMVVIGSMPRGGWGELERLEQEARAGRRGLWSDADPVAPWEWRLQVRAARNLRRPVRIPSVIALHS